MSSLRSWRSACAALLLVAGAGCQPSGERALIEGDRLLSASRPAEAIPLLERAVETLPQNAIAMNRLGLAYQYAGRLDDARKQYLRALKADQNLFEAQHNLGILYFQMDNWIEAERCLRIWLGRHPEDLDAWNRLGLSQYRNGASLEAAEQSLSMVARGNGKDPEVWNTLGLISIKRHKYKEAQQRFGYGLKLDPGNAALHLNLAVLCQQYLNDRHNAIIQYRTFLEISPNAPEAPSIRALLLQLDPPAVVPPRADATNHAVRTLVALPGSSTNTPIPVTARPPPATNPPAEVNASRLVPPVDKRPPTNATPSPAVVTKPSAPPQTTTAPLSTPSKVTTNVDASATVVVPPKKTQPAVAPREIVKVEDDSRPVAALDVPAPAFVQPAVPGIPALTNAVATNAPTGVATASFAQHRDDVADPSPEPQSKPKSFWKKVNPVSWFKGDGPKEIVQPKPTPLDLPQVDYTAKPRTVPVPTPATNRAVATVPVPAPVLAPAPPPKPVVPRYRRQDAARLTPGDRSAAEPEFAAGSEAQEKKNYPEAMAAYRQATDLDRSYFEAYYNWSLAALDAGDASQAVAAAENATLLQPGNDDARLNFAISLQRAGFPADAAEEYEKLSTKRPGDAALHFALGSLYARELLDNDKARPHYARVIAIAPNHPKADSIRAWLVANH